MQLASYVEINPLPEPDFAVVERLAEIAQADVDKSLDILNKLILADIDRWRVHGWEEPARGILSLGLDAPGSSEKAREIIDRLGRKGYLKFGELLRDR